MRLGVSPQALSYYETEKIKVPDDIARSLAQVWDLDELYVRRQLGLWTPSEGMPVVRPGDVASAADVPDNVVVLPLRPGQRLTDGDREALAVMARQLANARGDDTT
jgi:hypothetical protein